MTTENVTVPVPGIVGVIVGCPDGCGATFEVRDVEVRTSPARMGMIASTVIVDAGAMLNAYGQHLAEGHGQ